MNIIFHINKLIFRIQIKVQCTNNCPYTGAAYVGALSYTPNRSSIFHWKLNISNSMGVRTNTNRMFTKRCNIKNRSRSSLHCIYKGIQRSVSTGSNYKSLAIPFNSSSCSNMFFSISASLPFNMFFCNFQYIKRRFCIKPLFLKHIIYFFIR